LTVNTQNFVVFAVNCPCVNILHSVDGVCLDVDVIGAVVTEASAVSTDVAGSAVTVDISGALVDGVVDSSSDDSCS